MMRSSGAESSRLHLFRYAQSPFLNIDDADGAPRAKRFHSY